MPFTMPPSDTNKKNKTSATPRLSFTFSPCWRTSQRELLHQQSGRLLLLALIKKDVERSYGEVNHQRGISLVSLLTWTVTRPVRMMSDLFFTHRLYIQCYLCDF